MYSMLLMHLPAKKSKTCFSFSCVTTETRNKIIINFFLHRRHSLKGLPNVHLDFGEMVATIMLTKCDHKNHETFFSILLWNGKGSIEYNFFKNICFSLLNNNFYCLQLFHHNRCSHKNTRNICIKKHSLSLQIKQILHM